MTITTQDCKDALVSRYPDTTATSWKRTRKYLNAFGQWERVFECNQPGQVRAVVLQERNRYADRNYLERKIDEYRQGIADCEALLALLAV